jgi:hypothetical protein
MLAARQELIWLFVCNTQVNYFVLLTDFHTQAYSDNNNNKGSNNDDNGGVIVITIIVIDHKSLYLKK